MEKVSNARSAQGDALFKALSRVQALTTFVPLGKAVREWRVAQCLAVMGNTACQNCPVLEAKIQRLSQQDEFIKQDLAWIKGHTQPAEDFVG